MNQKKELEKDLNRDILSTQLLKNKGLSVTVQRKIILGLLLKEHGPFSAEEVLNKLPKNSCDQATVYRCLNQFVEVKLVNISFLDKDMAYFEFNDPDHHHHHIICKICKKIESFHECLVEKIELNFQKKGYTNIQHRLEIFAVCETCSQG